MTTSLDTLPIEAYFGAERDVIGQSWYARRTGDNPTIVAGKDLTLTLSEGDAIQELDFFLDAVRQSYVDHGYHARAESAHRFQENIHVIDSDMFNDAATNFADELATITSNSPRVTVIHASSDDIIDQQVGSSEYIVESVFKNMRQNHPGTLQHVEYKSIQDILNREPVKGEKILFYDDWTITGSQVTKILGALGAQQVEARFVALRENWRKNVIAWPDNAHTQYWHGAPAIDNIAEGPSIIGTHSSVNIGWQNRLAIFGVDRALLRGDTPLPLLGDVIRPYRSRLGHPHYYRKPTDTIWRLLRDRGDSKATPEFSVQALTKHFRKP